MTIERQEKKTRNVNKKHESKLPLFKVKRDLGQKKGKNCLTIH